MNALYRSFKMTELQILEQNSNLIVEAFKVDGGAQSLFDRIAEQARSVVPDLSTDKGRKAIASMARKVASSKTAFDAHGKELKEQYTAITSKIDADRKSFRDQCDALRDEIRKPLTDWENAEKDRVEKHENSIKDITDFLLPENINVDAEVLDSNIRYLEKVPMGTMFEEYEERIKIAKLETLEKLRSALVDREKYESEQAELERLRQADIERQQKERDEKIALEATQKAKLEAEEKARFESERVEREKKEAAEKAQREKIEAEQREARLKLEKEQAELREAQLKQKAIDDAKQAEINKQKAVEAERQRIEFEGLAKEESERQEREAREADQDHKRSINQSIIMELGKFGIDEEKSKELILAIYRNQIPNIKITY